MKRRSQRAGCGIRHGVLGFTYNNFMSGLPCDLSLSVPLPGAVVLEVDPRSAAERAGLKPAIW
jgi:S1-C subfamily serine protease